MLEQIILASVLVSLASLIGLVVLAKKNWSDFIMTKVLAAAAGALLASAFLHLIPEMFMEASTEAMPLLSAVILITILALVALEQMVAWHHCRHNECEHDHGHHHLIGNKATAYSILIGDGLHNIVDGMVIASAFMVSPTLGWTATVAILLHEIPHEIGDFGILIASGMSKFKAALYNLISGLTALLGAVATYYFAQILEYEQFLLAIAAGSFIYIALSDILPELQHHAKRKLWPVIASLLLGVVVIWLVGMLVPEIH